MLLQLSIETFLLTVLFRTIQQTSLTAVRTILQPPPVLERPPDFLPHFQQLPKYLSDDHS
jgi:hypothetical protein